MHHMGVGPKYAGGCDEDTRGESSVGLTKCSTVGGRDLTICRTARRNPGRLALCDGSRLIRATGSTKKMSVLLVGKIAPRPGRAVHLLPLKRVPARMSLASVADTFCQSRSANTAKAVAASDINLPSCVLGSRFSLTEKASQAPLGFWWEPSHCKAFCKRGSS
jgi:hypothetical protein